MEILQYSFMQKALVVGIFIGIMCPIVGLFLVLRRLSMVGDTLAHVSLSGVMLGFLWGLSPLPLALGLSLAISLLLEKLRNSFKAYGELSLAIIMAAGLGSSVVLMGLVRSSDTGLASILFGSIITLTDQDVLFTILLACGVLAVIYFSFPKLFYLTFDEEGASLAGIPVKFYNHLLIALTAAVISLGLRIVGALLISSLMVVPVATSLVLKKGFKATLFWAIIFSLGAVLLGITGSFYWDLAPGGTIVVMSVVNLLLVMAIKKLLSLRTLLSNSHGKWDLLK